ncbi:cell wall-binding repeat-containing protein [Leifsonia sp. NPDC058292]|uniref:cell wall-binding repeat-containing protein n=1 Tax=Leifsonia sp. NPDC058292 TaxID=3346428 RepID=UPI0036DE3FDD
MQSRRLLAVTITAALLLPLGFSVQGIANAERAAAASQPAITSFPAGVSRLSGVTRYDTAVAISQRYQPGVDAAFVATGADFPDALSAAAAAAELRAPLLLTQPSQLPAAVGAELARLQPDIIYLVGGTGVVSAGVEEALSKIADVKRLGGPDRYDTADAIIRTAFDETHTDHAIIATGRTFPDALAATGAAGARHAPIVLVDGMKPALTSKELLLLSDLGVTTASLTGGDAVVSAGIKAQLAKAGIAVTRYGGADRYGTAALLNQAYFSAGSSTSAFLATGLDFPDALAAGALAGGLAAPLELSTRTCVEPAVGDQLTALGAASTVVLGGEAVVSASAANAARCVHPTVTEPLVNWATSNWNVATGVAAPYSDRPPVDVNSSTIKLDSTGLLIYTRADTHTRADHPVAYAQYGISALLEYQRTGQKLWLDRAIRQGDRLIATRTDSGGAWWYPYTFPWTYYQRTLTAPWWSGMAQGEALSLFTRLAEATHDSRWDTAADHTFASFTRPHSTTAPWSSLVIDKHLYFEEYAGDQPPLLVLNGHVFALFGLYDYWKHTGNATAARYFDGGATTVLERMMPLVRVEGGVSYYCVQADYCQSPLWQNKNYHPIHSWQLDTLARLTGDSRFTTWSDQLRSDWVLPLTSRSQPLFPGDGSVDSSHPESAPDLGGW